MQCIIVIITVNNAPLTNLYVLTQVSLLRWFYLCLACKRKENNVTSVCLFVCKMSTQKRKVICKENSKHMQQHIADFFTTKWDLPINSRSVGDISSKWVLLFLIFIELFANCKHLPMLQFHRQYGLKVQCRYCFSSIAHTCMHVLTHVYVNI